jgi:hypothetical protein
MFGAGEYEDMAYAAGVDSYLRKPEGPGYLTDCVKHLIGKEDDKDK